MASENAALPAAAIAAIERGQLIEAIKLTREASGLGLKEAKDAVEAWQRGERSQASGAADDERRLGSDNTLPLAAIGHLEAGQLIEAIRATREANGMGLKDSKQAVEAYLAANVGVRERFQAAAGRRRQPWLAWAVAAALLAALAYTLLR